MRTDNGEWTTVELEALVALDDEQIVLDVPAARLETLIDELAVGVTRRLDPGRLLALPTDVDVVVVAGDRAFERRVRASSGGVALADATGAAAMVLRSQRLVDLLRAETGQFLLASMLRAGLLTLDATDPAARTLVLAAHPVDDDADGRIAAELVVAAAGESERKVKKRAGQVALGPILRTYVRMQAESMELADVARDFPPFRWAWIVEGKKAVDAGEIVVGADGVTHRMLDDQASASDATVTMTWHDAEAFVLYFVRRLDFRDALMSGAAEISGDLQLAADVYPRVARHGF